MKLKTNNLPAGRQDLFTDLLSTKILAIFLIVCFSFGIMIMYPSKTQAKNVNLGVSGTVDQYLAVYMATDGSIKAETNTVNSVFADEKLCVINF